MQRWRLSVLWVTSLRGLLSRKNEGEDPKSGLPRRVCEQERDAATAPSPRVLRSTATIRELAAHSTRQQMLSAAAASLQSKLLE